jgi:hypothetical protein
MSQTPPPPPPMRVEQIEYQTRPRRPRVFSVLGVISIVLAVAGIVIGGARILLYSQINGVWTNAGEHEQLHVAADNYFDARRATLEAQSIHSANHQNLPQAQKREAELSTIYHQKMAEATRWRAIAIRRMVGVTLLNLLLDVFLFVAGIAILINARAGRQMHLIYALIKIPLEILSLVVWMVTQIQSPSTHWISTSIWIGVQVAVMCVYPIILLIIMRRRYVVEYCAQSGIG